MAHQNLSNIWLKCLRNRLNVRLQQTAASMSTFALDEMNMTDSRSVPIILCWVRMRNTFWFSSIEWWAVNKKLMFFRHGIFCPFWMSRTQKCPFWRNFWPSISSLWNILYLSNRQISLSLLIQLLTRLKYHIYRLSLSPLFVGHCKMSFDLLCVFITVWLTKS